MRLRTDIITVDGKTTLAVIGGFDPSNGGKKIAHDAMVAHALVMAMDRLDEDARFFVLRDADRLLAGWGYGED